MKLLIMQFSPTFCHFKCKYVVFCYNLSHLLNFTEYDESNSAGCTNIRHILNWDFKFPAWRLFTCAPNILRMKYSIKLQHSKFCYKEKCAWYDNRLFRFLSLCVFPDYFPNTRRTFMKTLNGHHTNKGQTIIALHGFVQRVMHIR
jgi:hypothetical protein